MSFIAKASFAVLITLLAGQASAQSVRVQGECGFSFVPCDLPLTTFVQGAAPLPYDGPADDPIFTLQYTGNNFVMTALRDNNVAGDSLPFILDIYPLTGPLKPPLELPSCDPLLETCYVSTSLAYVPMIYFPKVAGT